MNVTMKPFQPFKPQVPVQRNELFRFGAEKKAGEPAKPAGNATVKAGAQKAASLVLAGAGLALGAGLGPWLLH